MPIKKKPPEPIPTHELKEAGSANEFVYVEKSVTKNMGDYNSAKVTVGIQTHLNPTEAQMLEVINTITVLTEVVDKRLEEEIKILLEDSDGEY